MNGVIFFRNQSNSLEKDLLNSAQKFDELRRLKDNVQRERDNLRSDVVKLNNQIADLRHTIMMQSNTMDGLRLDINRLNVKVDEAKINVSKAEKERDEMAQEVETLHEKIEYYQGEYEEIGNVRVSAIKLSSCTLSILLIRASQTAKSKPPKVLSQRILVSSAVLVWSCC